ncbi:MAG: formylmethanofuran dehydrogenase, partial [Leptothrix sp. (in: b-proteobacteria)]
RIDGQPATLDAALAAAAARLGASRQPLLGGWGCDVAGARALYRLAVASGAVCDVAGGEALNQTLRAMQDRGGYTTTLGEVQARAELIVVVGSWAPQRAPRLLNRWLAADPSTRQTAAPVELVYLGDDAEVPGEVTVGDRTLTVERIGLDGDLAQTLARLHASVAGRTLADDAAQPALTALAQRLRASGYAVLAWEAAQLGPHAGLVIERLYQLVGRLNQTTRAAGFPIGGGLGTSTAQAVHTWLSGLPMRSRVGPNGLEHDPLRYNAARLLADGAVDLLLWTSAFHAGAPFTPIPTLPAGRPRIVLGLPALQGELGDEADTVFIPVATPGVHASGHLFRVDGIVLMPLHVIESRRDARLPDVADVVSRLLSRLETGS